MFDLLVIGELNPDLILRGNVTPAFGQAERLVDAAALTVGSSSAIMACGAARLGLRVAFCGVVGDDLFGRFMLDALTARGIDTSACVADPVLPTGLSVILARPGGDRAILTYPGSIPALTLHMIDHSLLNRARHLHVGSYFLLDALRPDLPELFRDARRRGMTTSLDTNYDPSGRWALGDMLHQCDIFLPNAAEALAISGAADLPAALDHLAARVPTLAVKLGADGAVARQGATEARAQPPAVAVVDTVGAGDSFDAGFVCGYLKGWPLERALRLGLVCGALSTTAAGGTEGQPVWEEAISRLDPYATYE